MLKLLLLLVLVAGTSAFIVPHLGRLKGHKPNTYKVQIDDPPIVRWAPMVHDYRHALDKMMD